MGKVSSEYFKKSKMKIGIYPGSFNPYHVGHHNISLNDCSVDILISIIKEINVHNIPYSKFKKVFNYVIPTLDYEFFKLVEDKYVFLGIVSNVSLPHRDNGFVYVNDDIQDITAEKDEEGLYPYLGSNFKLLKTSEDTRYLKQGENYFKLQTTRSNIINYVF